MDFLLKKRCKLLLNFNVANIFEENASVFFEKNRLTSITENMLVTFGNLYSEGESHINEIPDMSNFLSHDAILPSHYSASPVKKPKGCVHYICASLFFKSKTKVLFKPGKKVFYFTSKALFVLEKIKF